MYLAANATLLQETLPEAVRSCARTAASDAVASFDLTLTVAGDGQVVGTTTEPANAFTSCVAKAVETAVWTAPPRIPTEVYLDVSIAR